MPMKMWPRGCSCEALRASVLGGVFVHSEHTSVAALCDWPAHGTSFS